MKFLTNLLSAFKGGTPHSSSGSSADQEIRSFKYDMSCAFSKLAGNQRRYSRTNSAGSHFSGTEVDFYFESRGITAPLALEDFYNNVGDVGDNMAVVLVDQHIGSIGKVGTLPVLVINKSKLSYSWIETHLRKVANDEFGGEDRLRKEVTAFAKNVAHINLA